MLPKFAMESLKDHRAANLAEGNISRLEFCSSSGQFVNKSNLIGRTIKPTFKLANDEAQEAAKTSKQPVKLLPNRRFHDLRHTHATTLLSQGHFIKAVGNRLGHSDVAITLRVYAHVLLTDDALLAEGLERIYG